MVKKILILAANPKETMQLRLDEEVREIENGLERSTHRDKFEIKYGFATRPKDLRRMMLDFQPNLVHFCGHGKEDQGIILEDDSGKAHIVNTEALADFFKLFSNHVDCVILNACYSKLQAHTISQHINYVIGMKQAIGDKTAIEFSVAFYDALGAGKNIEFAFELAINSIQIKGTPEHLTPTLIKKSKPDQVSKNIQKKYRFIGFDLDGTLLRGFDFSWRLIWAYLGYSDRLRKIGMKRYLSGKLSYAEWGEWCCNYFKRKNLKKDDFKNITKSITLTNNFHDTISILKEEGFILAIISGGVDVFIEEMIPDAHDSFDYIFINKLLFDEHRKLTGLIPTKYDFDEKADGIQYICHERGIEMEQTVFVGEGFNDDFVSRKVGLSIAYPPLSQGVKEAADIIINEDDLSLILPYVLV